MTKLIIVRHGNTFDKGEICLRVGCKTDLLLSNSGKEQAILLGKYLKLKNIIPDKVFASDLKRTYQTAEIAFKEAGISIDIEKNKIFNEIDYGPDEAKTEEEVIGRIGKDALEEWDKNAIVPKGWIFNPDEAIQNWYNFAKMIEDKYTDKLIMVFTSNGIARFAPYLTGDFEKFIQSYNIKISTSALCIFEKNQNDNFWNVLDWNIKPKDFVNN